MIIQEEQKVNVRNRNKSCKKSKRKNKISLISLVNVQSIRKQEENCRYMCVPVAKMFITSPGVLAIMTTAPSTCEMYSTCEMDYRI